MSAWEGKVLWHYTLHGAVPRFLQSRMALLVSLEPEHVFPRCLCCKASSEVSESRLCYLCRFKRSMVSELLNEGTFAEKWHQWIEWTVGGRDMLFTVDNGARPELQVYPLPTSTAFQITCFQGCSFKVVTHVSPVLPAYACIDRESIFSSIRAQ